MSHLRSIIRKATKAANERLNVVTFPTHERYQSGLANINADFYLWQGQGIKPWVDKYAKLPDNHILLNPKYKQQLPDWIVPDLVLSQNKLAHHEISTQIAQHWQIPLVCIEHTLPMPTWPEAHIRQLSQMRGNLNIFISEYSKNKWLGQQNDIVIRHGIDVNKFKPNKEIKKKKLILSVVNDWINRDEPCGFKLWQTITGYPNPIFPLFVVGDTPGLSVPAKDTDELINAYNMSSVFLNTSLVSPVPTALMEAMSCGLAVVSTNNCMIPEIIQHGYNGLLSNDPSELREFCEQLLHDDDLRTKLGNNARQTIIDKYHIDTFATNWNSVLHQVANFTSK